MIHIREEGEPLRNGFNFYPLSDAYSSGFVFRLGDFVLLCRYSKTLKRWVIK